MGSAADARAAVPDLSAPSWMDFMSKTAGGKQFWADVCFFHEWRIQRNVLTGHHRLLDGTNRRHASGTYETCQKALEEIRRRDKLAPMQGKAVVILHGLFRTRSAMAKLRTAIADGNYLVFCMGYPTTRGSVADHARSLDSAVRSLEGISEINFVAHSLGNLVVRHWLKDIAEAGVALPAGLTFGRMVMLAPPNFQPQLATKLLRTQFATFIAGAAAEQMATGWENLESRLTTPPFEFGVLAGGKGDNRGYNPLIPGDDDGVITVESTRLPGARDFRRLSVLHSFFMNDPKVHEMTARFLAHGYFESAETRQPIESM
jgi:predicted alpha/beta hydrolase family esterase